MKATAPPAAMPEVKVFWFRRRPNFGDALAPLMVERFAGLCAEWAPPERAQAFVMGSIAGRLPRGFRGAVLGVGKIAPGIALDLSSARVFGLRGELTLRDSRAVGDIVLGDTGLLVADLLGERPPVVHRLGVVPHYKDRQLAARHPDAHHVDVTRDPLEVVREIASCERIVSSSLHGIVAAYAFAIPRLWAPCDGLIGGRFKFHDYATALRVKLEPDTWATAPEASVSDVVTRLRAAFRELPAALPEPAAASPMDEILDTLRTRVGQLLRASRR